MSETPRTTKSEAIRTLAAYCHAACDRVEQLETELADKEKQLAEARAEIERLKSEHEDSLCRAKDNAVSLSGAVTEYAGELLVKDRLIEQMKADLQRAKENFETMDKTLTTQCASMSVAKAAYNTGMSYLNDALVAERTNE